MSDVVIRAEGVSKRYRLGQIGATTLREDFSRLWAGLLGRPDPTLGVGVGDAARGAAAAYVWALEEVGFEVRRGEALAIIGRNGAGKSTLLKILSRITAPTAGRVFVKGRIASLLEVGTGFHGELTGRENIYLNGAVLGMSRAEVARKLDDIIAFSGCERFIDTPVKRYSSGMVVRLGFAVAAHLDAEVLVVDEVLAVGDAEFQRRCLGKMRDVTGHGRTVLFVSHNMAAVESLCPRAILLDAGGKKADGEAGAVIARYLGMAETALEATLGVGSGDRDEPHFLCVRVTSRGAVGGAVRMGEPIDIVIDYWNSVAGATLHVNLLLYAEDGYCVLNTYSDVAERQRGRQRATCRIPADLLNARTYSIRLLLVRDVSHALCDLEGILAFSVHEGERSIQWFGPWPGAVRPRLEWDTVSLPD
jgi:lipopolysaccharide transport system ATP-binding protein